MLVVLVVRWWWGWWWLSILLSSFLSLCTSFSVGVVRLVSAGAFGVFLVIRFGGGGGGG